MPPLYDCCLFDMDGLLLDTEKIYTTVSQDILSKYRTESNNLMEFTWDLKKRMIGLREDEACKLFVEVTKIPITAEEYKNLRTVMHSAYFPSCRPLAGVMKLITYLHKRKVPICVYLSVCINEKEPRRQRDPRLN
jgi:pseudouridine-5'-monophosphatase